MSRLARCAHCWRWFEKEPERLPLCSPRCRQAWKAWWQQEVDETMAAQGQT